MSQELAVQPPCVADRVATEAWRCIDKVEQVLGSLPQQHMPLDHLFTPGMYVRQIFIPAGTFATTRIHLTEHPFAILAGTVTIWDANRGTMTLSAPFLGVTTPGTRRMLYAHEGVIFATFHATNETDPDKLVDLLTFDPIELGHLDHLTPEQLAALRAHAQPRS